ncbi:transcriptional regulator, TetR family domain protein [Mycobacterium xenopi 4042]|uniref:Transcriptional regulator, TetR family domain protein n=1 Tax=Mycobacterium xenopi 4042 TaxID=1299334 RepID=X8C7K9_MYCXE|nr:transcriptional regulator, TetR family domain protein [Mycobacterium xenopi 4042]
MAEEGRLTQDRHGACGEAQGRPAGRTARPGTGAVSRTRLRKRQPQRRVAASYQVKMAMGAAEQVAAMTSLLRLHNQALFERIVAIWEDLFK